MNLDEQLDERLREAAPPVSMRTDGMRRELHALVEAATPLQRRRRKMPRASLVAVTTVGAFGVGTVAAAAGLLPGWSMLTGSGQTCQLEMTASAPLAGDGEPGTNVDATEQSKAVAAARVYLQNFDYNAINRNTAISHWQTAEDAATAAQSDPSERQPRLAGDDLEVTALTYEVTTRLSDHLASQGLDVRAVNLVTTTTGCNL